MSFVTQALRMPWSLRYGIVLSDLSRLWLGMVVRGNARQLREGSCRGQHKNEQHRSGSVHAMTPWMRLD
jgi:hypothetical protein